MSRTKLRDRVLPRYTKGEEIFNMVSHIVGGALGITATVLCVIFAAIHHNVYGVVSGALFGVTMIVLYTMSSIYHGLKPSLTAKKVFQAIRIEVNGELSVLEQTMYDFASVLKPGGRLAVITFHSLEDRAVKNAFARLTKGCECPPDFPVCVCGKKPQGTLLSRKPILPSDGELSKNPRSASAKLRIFIKA